MIIKSFLIFSLLLTTALPAFAERISSEPKRTVNLLDAGLLRITSGSATGVFSCTFSGNFGGKYPFFQTDSFTPEVGVKYVVPLNRDATCNGMGLSATVGVYKLDNQYFNSDLQALDIYFEDIATGARIQISKPDGCRYNNTYTKSLITNFYLQGVQMVVEVSSAKNQIFLYASFMDPNSSQYSVSKICQTFKGSNIR